MEYWDIYDKDRNLTGRKMKRNDWILKDGEYHISVQGVIQRPSGEYLITKRKMNKSWAPGWWEVPGGGVKAGETPKEAVVREVFEETGLDIKDADGGLFLSYERVNPGEGDNYFMDVFKFSLDFTEDDVHILPEEVDEFRLATAEEIKELAKTDHFLHYDSMKKVFE